MKTDQFWENIKWPNIAELTFKWEKAEREKGMRKIKDNDQEFYKNDEELSTT